MLTAWYLFEIASEQTPFAWRVKRTSFSDVQPSCRRIFTQPLPSNRRIDWQTFLHFCSHREKSWSNRAKFHRGNRGDAMKWWKKPVKKLSEIYSTMPALGIVSIEADGEKSGGESRIERIHR